MQFIALIYNDPALLNALPPGEEDEMMRGVVSLPHGWGHDAPGTRMAVAAERPGANLNAILDERHRDPVSGNAVLAGVAVAIQPA